MTMRIDDLVQWDGTNLVVSGSTDNGPFLCTIPRDTVHQMALYRDLLSWEIGKYRGEIVESLKPALLAKIQSLSPEVAGESVCLMSANFTGSGRNFR
jgi:hypothetical protein